MSEENTTACVPRKTIEDLYFRAACCKLAYVVTVLVASLLWMFFSWLQDQGDGTWFARSGAVPTVATVLASIWLAKYRELLLGDGGFRELPADKAYKKLSPYYTFLQASTLIVLVVSTLVWAYGDLVFRHLTC